MSLINVFTWGRYKKRNSAREKFEASIWLKIRELSVVRFEYENLPAGVKSYHIERILFDSGTIGWGKIGGNVVALNITDASTVNQYGDIDEFGLYSTITGFTKTGLKNGKTGVVGKNNLDSISTMALLTPWVEQLADIWFGMEVNRKNSRTFAIMTGTKDQRKTMLAQYESAMESESGLIFLANNKQFKVEKFDLKIEYTPDKYWSDYNKTWMSLIEFLGYQNNSVADKKQRVVVDEVNLQSELSDDLLGTMLRYREEMVAEVNRILGTNIIVKTRKLEVRDEPKEDEDE